MLGRCTGTVTHIGCSGRSCPVIHFQQRHGISGLWRNRYAKGLRWVALTRFLDDGRLEIDNNIAERAMRCIALRAPRTGYLQDPKRAVNGHLQSTRSSRPPSSTVSNTKPILQTSSPRSLVAGPHHAGTNSCHGTGKPNKT